MIEKGAWSTRTNDFGGTLHAFQSGAYKPALEKIAGFDINGNICAYPGTAWARQVFPGESDAVVQRIRSLTAN